MKRKIAALLLAFVMLLPTCVFAAEVSIAGDGTYTVDGASVITQGPLPYMDGETLYVPVVATLTSLGINAQQNGDVVTTANTEIKAASGTVKKDGATLVSKIAPVLRNGVVYAGSEFMKLIYDVTVSAPNEEGVVKASYFANNSAKVTISPEGKYVTETGETNGPACFEEDGVLFLPVMNVLSSLGISAQQNGPDVFAGDTMLTADSNKVYIGSTCYVAKRAPKVVNGVIFAERQIVETLYGVKVEKASDGTVTAIYGTQSGGADEGLQTDDSWYYEMVDQADPYEGLTDVEIIKKNITNSVYDFTTSPKSLLSRMRPDGSFTDIEYFNYETGFPPGGHIDRIATLCRIAYTPQNPYYRDPEVIDAIVKTTDYWMKHKFKSIGWWYNTVSTPQSWQSVMVTQPDCLDKYMDEIKKYCKGVEWGGNGDSSRPFVLYDENNTENMTRPYTGSGPGPAERMYVTMKELFWDDDSTPEQQDQKLRDCMEGLSIEFSFVATHIHYNKTGYPGESLSIMADRSYHDHANCFMQNAYGFHFLSASMSTLQRFKGTSYRLSDEAVIGMQDMLLDGYKWVFYNGPGNNDVYYVKNSMGRGTTGTAYAQTDYHVLEARKWYVTVIADTLLKEYGEVLTRAEELQDWVNWYANPSEENFEGNRYFWVSDYFSHHRKDWNFSILIPSARMNEQEYLTGQGARNLMFNAGYYCLLTDGDDNSYPSAHDFNRMAGITVEQNLPTLEPDKGNLGNKYDSNGDPDSKLAGAVSDGMYGFSMHEFIGMATQPKKNASYFCFDDEMVALGAGIQFLEKKDYVHTVLDQALTKDVVKIGDESSSIDVTNMEGDAVRTELGDKKWVLNGNVGYILTGENDPAYVETGIRRGNVSQDNPDGNTYADSVQNITIVGINHGKSVEDGSYAYTILPNTTEEGIQAYMKNPKIDILSNTKDLQAVWHKDLKILQAAFFKNGTVSTPGGELTLTVSQPTAVMVRLYDDGSYSVHASDIQHRTIRTQVEISGEVNTTLGFNFTEHSPGKENGWYAGKPMHYYSKDGDFKDIETYNPNLGTNREIGVAADLLAVMVNGKLLAGFDNYKHYVNIGTFDAVPEIKAKGNYETRVIHRDNSAIVYVTDPANPVNEAIYTFAYKVREPKAEA